ncbi:MAG: YhbY family RNA-binding protein [Pseudomonadales bacterium]
MDKKQLRAIGHHLKPVVTVAGAGLSENVLAELDRALNDHELIKVKLAVDDRQSRELVSASISEQLKAEVVQSVGKIILVLRRNSRANPKISNLVRHLSDI